MMSEHDPINPTHYSGKTMEAIDVIFDFGLDFCLGSALKYMIRAGRKGDRKEDLQKAIKMLEMEIDNLTT